MSRSPSPTRPNLASLTQSPSKAASRKAILANEKLKDAGMSAAIERALLQIFQNPSYLPHDPYKILLQSLRQSEVRNIQDTLPRLVAYTEMPPEGSIPDSCSEFTTAKLAAFGDSKGVGMRHLAKLVSITGINRVYAIVVALKEALGSLPRDTKTRGIEGTFMECVSVNACMSDNVSRPVTHRLEITVEALIRIMPDKQQASFDDGLMLFIRRVVEEAYLADRCSDIITDHLKVVMGVAGRNVQSIPLKTMRSRRQQVLSILKAAVVDDGEISLDMYLMVRRSLPTFSDASATYAEPSFGYVHITRRYRFSYCDERGLMRCFSTYPFESLARGVFFEAKDAKLYLQVFTQHHARMKTAAQQHLAESDAGRKKQKDGEGEPGVGDVLFSSLVYLMTSEARAKFDAGEVVLAAEWLLQLQALFTHTNPSFPYAIKQTAVLSSGQLGQVHCVREVLSSLEGAVSIIGSLLGESDYLKTSITRAPLSGTEAAEEYKLLLMAYESISPALLEFKHLLMQLFRDCKYSELQYLQDNIMETFFQTFDPLMQAMPLCNPDPNRLSRSGLAGVLPVIEKTMKHLEATRHALLAVEASLGADALLNVMGGDPLGVQVDTLGLDTIDNNHSWRDVPKTFMEYLGYMSVYAMGNKPNKSSVLRRPWRGLLWTGPLWRVLSNRQERMPTRSIVDAFGRKPLNPYLDPEIEDTAIQMSTTFWDLVASMGAHGGGRHAAIDYVSAVADEAARYGFPKFMSPEGAKMRYLVETHLVRGLQEGLFMSATRDRIAAPPYTALNSQLFKYSSYYQLHCNLPRDTLGDLVFRAAKLRDVIKSPALLNGAAKIAVTGDKAVGMTLGSEPLTLLGGVIGPNRVVAGLGPNATNIFRLGWHLPQIFDHPPSPQAGMLLTLGLGVAAETAVHWAGGSSLRGVRVPPSAASSATTAADAPRATLPGNAMPPLGTGNLHDPELSPIVHPGPIALELVVKLKYDQTSLETNVRKLFATIVSDALTYMSNGSDWRVEQVLCGGSSDDLAALGVGALHSASIPASTNIKTYPALSLMENAQLLGSMQQQAVRTGAAAFVCAVAVPSNAGQLTHEQLIKIFERLVFSSAPEETYRDESDGFGTAMEDPAYSDPTYNDVDRLCATGKASTEVQSLLSQSVRCYVPCVLRFTLLGVLGSYQATQVDSAEALANALKRTANTAADPTPQKTLPRVHNNCSIGTDGAVARLVGGTVWLSQETAAAVWKCTSFGALSCLERETATRAAKVRALRKQGNFTEAQVQGYVWSLLSRRYDLTPLFARQCSSLGHATWRVLQFVDMLQVLLEREDAVTLDTHVLGMTLVCMVAHPLRRILTSPSSVHLRGGCAVLMQKLRQLEKTLHIGTLALHIKEAPNSLPDNFVPAMYADGMGGATRDNKSSVAAKKIPGRAGARGTIPLRQGPLAVPLSGLKSITAADGELRRALNSSVEVCRSAVGTLKTIFGLGSALLATFSRDVDSWETLYGLDEDGSIESRWREKAKLKGLYSSLHTAAVAAAASRVPHDEDHEGETHLRLAEEAEAAFAARRTPEVSTQDAAALLFPWPNPESGLYRPHYHAYEAWIQREGDGTTQERLGAHLRKKSEAARADHGQHRRSVMRHFLHGVGALHKIDKEHKVMRYGENATPAEGPAESASPEAASPESPEKQATGEDSPRPQEGDGSPAKGSSLWKQLFSPRLSPSVLRGSSVSADTVQTDPQLQFGTLRKMAPQERAEFVKLVESLVKVDQQLAEMRSAGPASTAAVAPPPAQVRSFVGFGKPSASNSVSVPAPTLAVPVHDGGSPSRLGLGVSDFRSRVALDYSSSFSASGFAALQSQTQQAQGIGMLGMLRSVARGVAPSSPVGGSREVGLGVTDHGLVMGLGLEDENLHPHLMSFRRLPPGGVSVAHAQKAAEVSAKSSKRQARFYYDDEHAEADVNSIVAIDDDVFSD